MKRYIIIATLFLYIGVKAQSNRPKVTDTSYYHIQLKTDSIGKKFYNVIMPGGEPYGIMTYNSHGEASYHIVKFWAFDSARAYIRKESNKRYSKWKKIPDKY